MPPCRKFCRMWTNQQHTKDLGDKRGQFSDWNRGDACHILYCADLCKHCIKQQFHSNRLTDQPDTGIVRQICGFIPSPVLSVHNTSSISSSFCLQLSPPKSASVCPSSTRKSSGVSSSLCTGCSQRYCCSYLCRSEPAVSF